CVLPATVQQNLLKSILHNIGVVIDRVGGRCGEPRAAKRRPCYSALMLASQARRYGPPGADPSGGALQPAPYARAVAPVDIAELALEISFLAGHYAIADNEREGHQHHQQPEIIERDGQADQTQEHAEVDGVARKAVRSALDDGGGRQVGGDVRT